MCFCTEVDNLSGRTKMDELLNAKQELAGLICAERRELLAKATEAIDAILKPKTDQLAELERRIADAKRIQDERLVEEKTKGTSIAVGTVMIEWVLKESWSWRRPDLNQERRQSGRRGAFEVVTRESQFPLNQKYGRPHVGGYIVRLFKKDGTLGLQFEHYYELQIERRHERIWLPEGQMPPESPTISPVERSLAEAN
jgi:hypothetical protein